MISVLLLIVFIVVGILVLHTVFGEDENGHSWYLQGSDDHHFTCSNCGCDDTGQKAKTGCGT